MGWLTRVSSVLPWMDEEKSALKERLWRLQSENDGLKKGTFKHDVERPLYDGGRQGFNRSVVSSVDVPVDLEDLEKLSDRSDVLGSVLQTLRDELFKHGVSVEKKFEKWCPEGHVVEDEDAKLCPEHGKVLKTPDLDGKDKLEEWQKCVNRNGQSLTEVLKSFEDDLNVFDNGYLFLLYRYWIHPSKPKVLKREPVEVIRGDPKYTRLVVNKFGIPAMSDEGERLRFCPKHRDELVRVKPGEERSVCPKSGCNAPLMDAYYASSFNEVNGLGVGDIGVDGVLFYGEDEVVHKSKYQPSLTYGFPQTIKVMYKVKTLLEEDKYLKENFGDDVPPRRSLIIKSDAETSSILKTWKAMKERAREFAAGLVPFVTPSKDDDFQVLDLMKPLDELQFTQHRKEFRSVISTTFNVMPMNVGETDTAPFSRKMETENMLTEKAVRTGSNIYNKYVLPELCEFFDVFGWEFVLNEPDLESEKDKLDLVQSKVRVAKDMDGLGFGVEFRPGEDGFGEFVYSDRDDDEEDDGLAGFGRSFKKKRLKRGNLFDRVPVAVSKRMPSGAEQELDGFVDDVLEDVEGTVKTGLNRVSGMDDPQQVSIYADKLADEVESDLRDSFEDNFDSLFSGQTSDVLADVKGVSDRVLRRVKSKLLQDFLGSDVLDKSLKRLKAKVRETVSNGFESGLSSFSLDEFGEEMSEELGDVFSHVSTIVRTEAHSVSNGVRVEGYRQAEEEFGEEFRYDWKGPSDGRTTELCEEIKSRVPDEGLPLDELRELVNEVSDEYGFSELEFPTPHFNCRHQVVRVQ